MKKEENQTKTSIYYSPVNFYEIIMESYDKLDDDFIKDDLTVFLSKENLNRLIYQINMSKAQLITRNPFNNYLKMSENFYFPGTSLLVSDDDETIGDDELIFKNNKLSLSYRVEIK